MSRVANTVLMQLKVAANYVHPGESPLATDRANDFTASRAEETRREQGAGGFIGHATLRQTAGG
jgi:hypothetical protein